MKNAGAGFLEIEAGAVPKGIRAAGVKKSAVAAVDFRHDIGVGSGGARSDVELARVNLMALAIGQDFAAQRVVADQPGGGERKRGAEPGEIAEHIVGSAAGALGLAANIGQLLALGKDINELDLVNDPIATGEKTRAGGRRFKFHVASCFGQRLDSYI